MKNVIPVEDDLVPLVENMIWRKSRNHSKKYLLENINLMKSFDKAVTLAEKRTKPLPVNKTWIRLHDSVVSKFRRANNNILRQINFGGKQILHSRDERNREHTKHMINRTDL